MLTLINILAKFKLGIFFALLLSGCTVMLPFNQTPAELRASPGKNAGVFMFDFPFEKFVENTYLATTLCGDSLDFKNHPTKRISTASIDFPGLSSTASVLFAEAIPEGDKTRVEVWLHFNNGGWRVNVDRYLKKIEDPDSCSGSPKKSAVTNAN